MLIESSHKKWAVFTVAATGVALLSYAVYYHLTTRFNGNGPSGGSWPGLIYGFLGFGLMIFCGLLGLRKKVRVWRLGRAQTWMKAHIWLGLLSAPLIFCHSGMKYGNSLSLVLMILFTIVMVSGIIGLILQNILPVTMLQRIQAETTYEQIPHVIEILRDEADSLVSGVCGPLESAEEAPKGEPRPKGTAMLVLKKEGPLKGKTTKERGPTGLTEGGEPLKALYVQEIRPFLTSSFLSSSRLATEAGAAPAFAYTRTLVPEALHEAVGDLEMICDERRQLAAQERLHWWLHGWLFFHGPLSYALLLLALIHAIVAPLRY